MTRRSKTELTATNSKAKIDKKWTPRFWEQIDGRLLAVKYIQKLVGDLEQDANCDSTQKRLLASRAAFIALQLQTQEINHLEGKAIDMGSYTQMCNALTGLLNKLGLDKQIQSTQDLQEYIDGKWK